MSDSDTTIDYTIKIPLKQPGENIGCAFCSNQSTCQYHVEIFTEHHKGWEYTVAHRVLTEFIGLICKNFTKRNPAG